MINKIITDEFEIEYIDGNMDDDWNYISSMYKVIERKTKEIFLIEYDKHEDSIISNGVFHQYNGYSLTTGRSLNCDDIQLKESQEFFLKNIFKFFEESFK